MSFVGYFATGRILLQWFYSEPSLIFFHDSEELPLVGDWRPLEQAGWLFNRNSVYGLCLSQTDINYPDIAVLLFGRDKSMVC